MSSCNKGWNEKSFLLLTAWFVTLTAFAADVRIGAASVKITPPVGTPMAGYYTNVE
jgi:hypothetical protein